MPDPIPSKVLGLFDFQFHQVAMFCPSKVFGEAVHEAVGYWKSLGYTNWIKDTATLKGVLYGEPVETSALMLFNYDIMPMELEFLSYHGPSRWHWVPDYKSPFVSHMSVYTDDVIRDTRRMTERLGFAPFHRFITQSHTNPGVAGKKRFIESIFGSHEILGYDIKLIQKVPHDYNDDHWLGQVF